MMLMSFSLTIEVFVIMYAKRITDIIIENTERFKNSLVSHKPI